MSLRFKISAHFGAFSLDVEHALAMSGVTVIYGPSGSGKTSLLRAVAGLQNEHNSEVQFNGVDWQRGSQFTPVHKRRLAYVFQEPSLFPHLSVAGNLDYAYQRVAKEHRQYSPEYAATLLSIDGLLERDVASLSGGERQRVAIARAICSNPQLLIMDEPLAALDRDSKRQIMSVLESFRQTLNIPILYVSHALEEVARLADYLILMGNGRIIASGDIQAMLSNLDHSLARDVDAESVVMATVVAHDDHYGMSYLDSAIGQLSVLNDPFKPSFKGAINRGDSMRILIAARDVSLTLERQKNTSILNIFRAEVDAFLCDDGSQVTVRSLVNGVPILARITKKSLALMAIKKGDIVYLQAKSVALL